MSMQTSFMHDASELCPRLAAVSSIETRSSADRSGSASAALEVNLDVEPFPLGVRVGGGNEPWAIDAKSELKEMSVAHAGTKAVIDPARHSAAVSCAPQGHAPTGGRQGWPIGNFTSQLFPFSPCNSQI